MIVKKGRQNINIKDADFASAASDLQFALFAIAASHA